MLKSECIWYILIYKLELFVRCLEFLTNSSRDNANGNFSVFCKIQYILRLFLKLSKISNCKRIREINLMTIFKVVVYVSSTYSCNINVSLKVFSRAQYYIYQYNSCCHCGWHTVLLDTLLIHCYYNNNNNKRNYAAESLHVKVLQLRTEKCSSFITEPFQEVGFF